MTRVTGMFYWTFGNFSSRSFKTLTNLKTSLLTAIRKNSYIAGRNSVYFVKNILQDIEVGYYGVSKKWHVLNKSLQKLR